MSLSAGARVGPYEIVAAIGAGGMGEVYRARDSRLDRNVAIKILPVAFAQDPDRVARFEREAKAVAALSHPNILAIFDIGQGASSLYVVTELLEGESLRQWLANSGQISARQAIDITIQTARGLAAAHDKGIVHRDLKPENVFLTHDGQVKILDFGLARQARQAQGSGATETAEVLTDPGVVMGTVGYMAPEQIRAQAVDARTDLFALGTVLYEMLTGRRAFAGDTAADTMIAIVKEEPPEVTRTRSDLPPALDRIVRRCLEKKPEQRFQSARDLAFALDTLTASSGAAPIPSPAVTTTSVTPPRSRWMPWTIAAIAVLAFAGVEIYRTLGAADRSSWTGVLLGGPETAFDPHPSPDGTKLAFQAMVDNLTQVAVMDPATGVWTILTTDRSRGGVWSLEWSADASRIYFARNYAARSVGVFSVSALGGDERPVLENARAPIPLKDGSLLVAAKNPNRATDTIARYSPQTGQLDRIGGEMIVTIGGLAVSKDEREFAFIGWVDEKSTDKTPEIIVGNLETRRLTPILPMPGQYSSVAASQQSGQWLTFQKSGDLFRVVEVSDDGRTRDLISMTKPINGVTEGRDGSLYVSQTTRPQEVVRFGVAGGVPEKLAYSERDVRDEGGTLMLADGRIVLAGEFNGRTRIAAVQADGRQFPFVDSPDDSFFPVAPIGDQELACRLGVNEQQRIAIVSARTGQMVRPLKGTAGKTINSLAGSRDGKTLFFAHDGFIWSIPTTDGEPKKLGLGASVAPMADGRTLIVQILDQTGAHLVRMPVDGGAVHPIELALGNLSLWGLPLAPNAVASDGRIVFAVDAPDSWFEVPVVIDPATGRVTKIPLTFSGDIHGPGWTSDGRILATGLPTQGTIWRFRKEK